MKKFKFIIAMVLVLTFSMPVASSANNEERLDPNEIRELQSQILDLVVNEKEETVNDLPLYQKYQDFFKSNPDLEEDYINNLDAKKWEESKIIDRIKVNESKLVTLFEDGSFSVLENALTSEDGTLIEALPTMSARGVIQDTGEQTYTGKIGETFKNDARHDIWGPYKIGELHLVTNYSINSGSARITSTTITGTRAIFPAAVSGSSSIPINNARIVESLGEYNFAGTCPGGWGTCTGRYHDISTKINIKYADNGVITFTVRSIVSN
ncbi:hypothetical protein C0Q44_02475 [Paenibacillus sp. PCH8]|uniref:hypothetical protein n=1 Tax=Paenibacillus sp. PCH8 TaxID=2066524 RepID=UPI000CF91823|nr:hypothetical protein [Paenibacillus sp. PCH8]PQP83577.1 hypothetical protein C0Q44_02475 [Paenibacillus sp. PCH8]